VPNLPALLLSAPAILFGLTIHEFSHGYVAWRLGDPTARSLGRLTLNPLRHLDPVGTVALFFFRFGWGRPVPIDPAYFRHPTRDLAISALAGPAANLLTAAVAGGVVRVLTALGVGGFWWLLADNFVFYNLILCFFNLVPIPPLDGSRLLYHLLPGTWAEAYSRLERYGFLLLIVVILAGQMTGVSVFGLFMNPLLRIFGRLLAGVALA
jgi:Zn-dependent protease